jgi:hypothetical protein
MSWLHQSRSNWLKVAVPSFAAPMFLLLVLISGGNSSVFSTVFDLLLCIGGGLIFGLGMWYGLVQANAERLYGKRVMNDDVDD